MLAHSSETQRRSPRFWRGIGAWILALGMLPFTASALEVHSVQIGVFGDAAQAEQARVAAAESCFPAFVQEDTSGGTAAYKVLVGHFPYFAEAWVCMKNLLGQGLYPGSSVATWEWDGRALEQSRLPVDLPFNTDGLVAGSGVAADAHWVAVGLAGLPEPDAALLAKPVADMTQAEFLQVGLAATDKAVAVPALQRLIAESPTVPELNRARLRLARLTGVSDAAGAAPLLAAVRSAGTNEEKALCDLVDAYILSSQKKRPESMAAFKALANNPALAPSLRLEAMERFARHAHALRDYPTAWLAFEQLEASAPGGATAAVARMQRAACAFELVGHAKGTWDEARRLCQSVETIDGAPVEPRATARLMFAETFYHQKNYDRTVEEADRLVADFPTIARERVTAMYWKARSLEELHRVDEALTVYAVIETDSILPTELFPALNAKAKGLFHQARLLSRKGDETAAQAAAAKLLERYPDTLEARAFRAGQDLPDE